MNKRKKLVSTVLLFAWVTLSAIGSDFLRPSSPPAVPLVTSDPYLSVWSEANHLYDDTTRHWTHREHPLVSLVRVDDKTYRLMGNDPQEIPSLPQVGLKVTPTRSIYDFENGNVHLTLTFMTAALPDDLDVLTRPLSYLTWEVHSVDHRPHAVSLYYSTSSLLTVNEPKQQVTWSREVMGNLTALKVGTVDQPLFKPAGDDTRIDWGYAYVATPTDNAQAAIGGNKELLSGFVSDGKLPIADDTRMPRGANDDQPVLAFAWDLGQVGDSTITKHALVAYDEIYEINFANEKLVPYWKRNGATASDLLQVAEKDYPSLITRCQNFDQQLTDDLTKVGGKKYAEITTLAYRQCLAGTGIAADAKKQPLLFTKENTSNGDIATVDVIFPMEPIFIALSPALAKASLVPVLVYAASDRWKFPNAPHDLGTYPIASATGNAGEAMVVEESGNMLILADAIMQADGDTQFITPWWPQLTQWAKFLEQYGLDPEDQLCTDDFMGHLAHNANLSIKAIVALAAYGDMCKRRGDLENAKRYHDLARVDAKHWMKAARYGSHYRLAFDKPKTWSQKYNLVWDKLLGLNVFPPEVAQREIAYYKKVIERYGLPLDSRTALTKTDWSVWTATMAETPKDFEFFISPIDNYLNHTTAREPLVDSYTTNDIHSDGFHARPVVGGLFIKMLSDDGIWKKWASADKTPYGPWDAFPRQPIITYILPTTATDPLPWRKTETKPVENWNQPDFDDSSWPEAPGGFGTYGPAKHTAWGPNKDSDIWLRKTFTMPEGNYPNLAFAVLHDNAVEIYVNGIPAFKAEGHQDTPEMEDIAPAAKALFQPGAKITLAVHCHQDDGGQAIDVRLVNITPAQQ